MPRISYFRGIVILMFSNEGQHAVGHFHARSAEHHASLRFDGSVMAGSLPSAQLRLVQEWAALHESELKADWERARRGERVNPIDPLS